MAEAYTAENLKEAVDKVRKALKNSGVALNEMKFPESMKDLVTGLKEEFASLLERMPTIDAVPAAADANYCLNSLSGMVQRCQDGYQAMVNSLAQMSGRYATAERALNESFDGRLRDDVKKKVDEQIASGALLTKESAEALVVAAKAAARTAVLNEVKTISTRKEELTAAKLPLPMDDAALMVDDAGWAALKTSVGDRTKKMAAHGLALASADTAPTVRRMAYSATFDVDWPGMEAVLKKSGGGRQGREPLMGDPAKDGKRRFVG